MVVGLAVLWLGVGAARAVDGDLDASFNGTGKQTIDFGFTDRATAVVIQPDGKIVMAGFDDGGLPDFAVVRLNPDGSLDTTFNATASPTGFNGNGRLSFTFGASGFGGVERATAAALQADGKIVVAGFTDAGGGSVNNFAIARINANGTLDTTFNGTGKQTVDFGFDDQATGVVIQPDGKIVVVGFDDGGAADFAVVRLNPDGSLDTTFNATASPTGFNGNGRLSFTFGAPTFGGVERAAGMALQPDGRIVVVGPTDAGGGAGPNNFAIARINPNGTLDLTFNGTGKQTTDLGGDDQATGVAIQADGKIVVVGATAGNFAVARYDGRFESPSLLAAVLPSSRSVQVGTPATAFATLLNVGSEAAVDCALTPITSIPAAFSFQTTSPLTNQVTGTPNAAVDVAAGIAQSFVMVITPTAPVAPTDLQFSFDCANRGRAPVNGGLNTLLFSASAAPTPDIVALAATSTGDGIVNLPGPNGNGAFAVATVNVGVDGVISVLADTGGATLPVTLFICQTNAATGQCVNPVIPTPNPVVTNIAANTTPTFGIFVAGNGTVPFDPAANRIFVRFKDAGDVTRGSTSVAVRTQ
jgi:uncharacterized delta-60 repeat protein